MLLPAVPNSANVFLLVNVIMYMKHLLVHGGAELRIDIIPAPHGSSSVLLSCLHDGVALEVQLKNDSNYVHYTAVIPDPAKKERFIHRKLLCTRESATDTAFSTGTNVPHLVYHSSAPELGLGTNFQSRDFILLDYVTPSSPYGTYTVGDSLFTRVNVFAGDCHDNLSEDSYSYVGFRLAPGPRTGWIRLQLKDGGHKVNVGEIAIVD